MTLYNIGAIIYGKEGRDGEGWGAKTKKETGKEKLRKKKNCAQRVRLEIRSALVGRSA